MIFKNVAFFGQPNVSTPLNNLSDICWFFRGSYSDVAAEGNFKLEERESQMSILTLEHGEVLTHCNK